MNNKNLMNKKNLETERESSKRPSNFKGKAQEGLGEG